MPTDSFAELKSFESRATNGGMASDRADVLGGESSSRLNAIDLFAGAGGFSLGMQFAGFETKVALEIDAWACETLERNHPANMVLKADIRDFSSDSAIREVCSHHPDVIVGGPPCQGFSVAGPARKDPADPRNSLFVNYARWVECLRPAVFVMENVKGLLVRRNAAGELVIDIIRRTFKEIGYEVKSVWVLNAAEFGVPQIRERVFIIGTEAGIAISRPEPTHRVSKPDQAQPWLVAEESLQLAVSLWDAISDLPALEAGEGTEEQPYIMPAQTEFQRWTREGASILFNHVAMSHSRRLVERFRAIKWGESAADVASEHGSRKRIGEGAGEISPRSYDQNNRRLFPDKPSHTIAASFYANFLHPFQHRNLTAREGARVQSFPDHYRFCGKKTVVSQKLLHREQRFDEKYLCQYNQIGNAVPPLLAKAVGLTVKKALNVCKMPA